MSNGDRDTRGEGEGAAAGKSAEFTLATDRILAPLICRAVRAVRMLGAGLGFPVGRTVSLTPPTSNFVRRVAFSKVTQR